MNRLKKSHRSLIHAISNFYLVTACCMVPSISQAQTIESIINRTITYLQGGLARTVGIFCIIIAGYLCLARQKFPKETPVRSFSFDKQSRAVVSLVI